MKKKKFNGKLSLNKEKISNLEDSKLNKIKGGIHTGRPGDPRCYTQNALCYTADC